jgi:antitoxin (DNA-binding transcriptional repressor) of toxin-antitoxin stability system
VYTSRVHNAKPRRGKTRVGIRDLRSNLSGYLKRAREGQVIEVTSRKEVVAELRPPMPFVKEAGRKPGALKGKIRIAPDFNGLPQELLDAFES